MSDSNIIFDQREAILIGKIGMSFVPRTMQENESAKKIMIASIKSYLTSRSKNHDLSEEEFIEKTLKDMYHLNLA